jgi:hypothetical protein
MTTQEIIASCVLAGMFVENYSLTGRITQISHGFPHSNHDSSEKVEVLQYEQFV